MRQPRSVEFITPPQRGLPRALCEHEQEVADLLRRHPPGGFVTVALGCTNGQAESLRRRIYRGRGVWVGGADSWHVVVRKEYGTAGRMPEWGVYVRRLPAPVEAEVPEPVQ